MNQTKFVSYQLFRQSDEENPQPSLEDVIDFTCPICNAKNRKVPVGQKITCIECGNEIRT